jgi:VIT1/CCC1 family predicted Fe2+/Mn2+ transporter
LQVAPTNALDIRVWNDADAMVLDGATERERIVDVNDGIISTAGIVEGFAGAGAGTTTIAIAALAAMVAGAIALGGAKYAEAADERDVALEVVLEEQRRLELLPEEELAELAELYEGKGLSPDLARQVAVELSERDALTAHAEAEYGLSVRDWTAAPLFTAAWSGLAFAIGSAVPLAVILLTPVPSRTAVTFFVVLAALGLTSVFAARTGRTSVRRTVTRTVFIGALTMVLTIAGGSLFDL